MKIVPDTNILISAMIKQGNPRRLLTKIVRSNHSLIISGEILAELAMVANSPRIRKQVNQRDATIFLCNVASASEMVQIVSKFHVVEEDPDDDVILQTAYDAKAGYIVSGDKHLLGLGRFRNTRILSVEDMLRIV